MLLRLDADDPLRLAYVAHSITLGGVLGFRDHRRRTPRDVNSRIARPDGGDNAEVIRCDPQSNDPSLLRAIPVLVFDDESCQLHLADDAAPSRGSFQRVDAAVASPLWRSVAEVTASAHLRGGPLSPIVTLEDPAVPVPTSPSNNG